MVWTRKAPTIAGRERVYQALLLTGAPGTGKTTLIKEALMGFRGPAGGFFTEEVRQGGARVGFDMVTLDGQRAPLARAGLVSPYRVGRYGVDVDALDRVGVRALRVAIRDRCLVVVDEIGKMELFSTSFREVVKEALDAGKAILGTVMLQSHPQADWIKGDPRVGVLHVTRENRGPLLREIGSWLAGVQERR